MTIRINYRRLLLEISILILFVSAVILACFIPWLFSQPVTKDSYASSKELLFAVEAYNFDKGPSESLEARLDEGLKIQTKETDSFFNLRARALYYYRLGYHRTAVINLDRSLALAPDDNEYLATLLQLVNIAHEMKDYELESDYQQFIDQF